MRRNHPNGRDGKAERPRPDQEWVEWSDYQSQFNLTFLIRVDSSPFVVFHSDQTFVLNSTERHIIRTAMTCCLMTLRTTLFGCLLLLCCGETLTAQPRGPYQPQPFLDKSLYHLGLPTPSLYLRELTIDGPGATESPYTVDAGHVQMEMTFARYSYDRESSADGTQRFKSWEIAPFIFKVGLLNHLDGQVVVETYNIVEERSNNERVTRRGFGDVTLRFKYNLWGNDSGNTAFAMTPYVRFPTSQDDLGVREIEGGLILPFEVGLPWDSYLGVTTRFDFIQDEDEDGYHPEFINSIALARDFSETISAYVELFSAVSSEGDSDWIATFDTGLVYWLTDSVQLNAGVNIGLTRAADDWSWFAGVAWRY
jgi:hypothetical protein